MCNFRVGVNSFVLFPKVEDSLKTNYGEESFNPNGLVPRAVKLIKSKYPSAHVITDVALDPYSSQVRYQCTTQACPVLDLFVKYLF